MTGPGAPDEDQPYADQPYADPPYADPPYADQPDEDQPDGQLLPLPRACPSSDAPTAGAAYALLRPHL